MFYVGLDVHAKSIVICVLTEFGKVYQRCTVRQVDQMLRFLEGLGEPFQVCFEASLDYGLLFETLSQVAERVVVAHPGKLHAIYRSKRKNDRNDAELLAKLLYIEAVPIVHVPSRTVRAWRDLITFRTRLVQKRTRAKNGVRALLRSLRIAVPARMGLWTCGGMAWLQSLSFENEMHALKRDLLVDEIQGLNKRIFRVEKMLARFAANCPAVVLLRSIPGVGPRTAEAVVAFIDDPKRFAHSKQVGAFFGLVPCQDQSGPVNRLGHITRQGPSTVRHLLTEAVWQSIRRSPTVKAYLERVQRGDPARKKIAIVATAHYLVRVMWSMLKTGSKWREQVAAQGEECVMTV
jgi:transposase